ncbi:hypothetical protein Godav_014006 [Gossypium davidsonii]|uniref:RNase H type-1 domain-containing protein n=1 Tax=Gossypium davidsonii TaxID=34287 RepID=A0A7J8RJ89_GOSDV|nr:hypothetical protein [Gossypium davidsonii]
MDSTPPSLFTRGSFSSRWALTLTGSFGKQSGSLKPCQKSMILAGVGLNNRLLVRDYSCWIDWIKDVMRVLDMKAEKPPCSFAKINFDAAVSNNKTNYGVIVHDSDGFVLEGGGGFKDELMSTKWSKLYAFEESLRIACSLNISKAIFETDCANLVNRVKNRGKDVT